MMEIMRAWPDSRFGIRTDNEILVEFRKVTLAIPEMDVRASIGEGNGRVADGFTVTLKKEHTLISVAAVLHIQGRRNQGV